MTGPVDWAALAWVAGLLFTAGTVVAGVVLWVWRLVASINKSLAERDAAAQLEVQRAKLVEAELRRELSDYQIHAAETFATKAGVTAAVERVESAVDRLTGRIDRLLENQAHPSPPRRRAPS